jgi:hypothetical protein
MFRVLQKFSAIYYFTNARVHIHSATTAGASPKKIYARILLAVHKILPVTSQFFFFLAVSLF